MNTHIGLQMQRFRYLILLIVWALLNLINIQPVFAEVVPDHEPLTIGPQFPLYWMYPVFEPESAWIQEPLDIRFSYSYQQTNVFAYSMNSLILSGERNAGGGRKQFKYCSYSPNVPIEYYWNCKDQGYSLFFDGEIAMRTFRFSVALSDWWSIHYAYRDIKLGDGNLDQVIEGVHDFLVIESPGKKWVDENSYEIHVWDNEANQPLYQSTITTDDFQKLSQTIGIKIGLLRDEDDAALSLYLSANFDDAFLKQDANELSEDSQSVSEGVDDFNAALLLSVLWKNWAVNGAVSATWIKDPIFPETPNQLLFYFLGINWSISEDTTVILQDLNYSSIFPADSQESTAGDDLNEMTLGVRTSILDFASLEVALVEDMFLEGASGPARIDITFYANIALRF